MSLCCRIVVVIAFGAGLLLAGRLGVPSADAAALPEGEQVLFVHLRCRSNQVSIARVDARPGRLKEGAARRGAFELQLTDAQGQAIWNGAIEDPRLRSFEFPADGSNRLARVNVSSPTVETVLRIPMKAAAREVVLLGEAPATSVAPQGAPDSTRPQAPKRPVLARFPIQSPPDTPRSP
ncbi:MAG: hypothetical protein HYR88_08625 [Verrucomicrobia bacterium]|nr:hypothetical protein [Verrucomicrobiota bacterium]MBI3868714.1 hypothetical protein [Verrucomicrobiota bacterium]